MVAVAERLGALRDHVGRIRSAFHYAAGRPGFRPEEPDSGTAEAAAARRRRILRVNSHSEDEETKQSDVTHLHSLRLLVDEADRAGEAVGPHLDIRLHQFHGLIGADRQAHRQHG